jgi:hypothetical protein
MDVQNLGGRCSQKNLRVALILQDSWARRSNRVLVSSGRRSGYLLITPRNNRFENIGKTEMLGGNILFLAYLFGGYIYRK